MCERPYQDCPPQRSICVEPVSGGLLSARMRNITQSKAQRSTLLLDDDRAFAKGVPVRLAKRIRLHLTRRQT